MAVVYNDTLKTGRMQAMADLVAGKTLAAATGAGSAGQLVIGTSGLSGGTGVLATIALPNPAFVISGAGTVIATLQGVPLSVAASASGTAAKAELRNNSGTTIASGLTVGVGSGDIQLTSTTITATQTVTVTAGTITHG
jgi:hypothetical protein